MWSTRRLAIGEHWRRWFGGGMQTSPQEHPRTWRVPRRAGGGAACGLLALGPIPGRKSWEGYRHAVNFSLLGAGEPGRVSAGHGLRLL
jgi:hypothetical protein